MPELPTGQVTFVFTDVEGSTRLVRDLGDSYVGVIADHRRLVREAFAERNGYEVDARGDEFLLAFQSPADAVETAIAIQESHDSHGWPDGPVRVRIGIHTGTASIEDDDYVGIDVHMVARLCAAGHGGQVLLSQATVENVGDVEVKDLGQHELRGLETPEPIFQLVLEGGAVDFPPLRLGAERGRPGRAGWGKLSKGRGASPCRARRGRRAPARGDRAAVERSRLRRRGAIRHG